MFFVRTRSPAPNRAGGVGGRFSVQPDPGPQRPARGELVVAYQAMLDENAFQRFAPALVIGGGEIAQRRQIFLRGAKGVERPQGGVAHRPRHRRHSLFPGHVKYRLVGFGHDRAEAVHAAHVVDRVGHRVTSGGDFGSPVPTMLSRVTSWASRSSLQPSVPAGRIGTTRNRVSAVESQMRISVSAGKVTPKSARTPFGSMTARERYGADLYQTGGS